MGKELLKSAVNIATDTLGGKKLSERSKDRLKESLANISTKYGSGKRKRPKKLSRKKKQYRKAAKRKIKSKNKILKKRKLDIFD